jgi:RHS repeat-associated protein
MPQIPQLSWDYGDRLHATARQAANGSGAPGTTYYVYDATGQRVRKVTERAASGASAPSVQAERFYLGTFEIYREYGNDGAVTLEREALHILADKHRLALVETRTAGTDRGPGQLIRYQLANHLDSSVLELDQHAQVITYEEYYAYGSTSYQAVRARTETPKRYRFTGRERDTETGLYYHGARYYAPWLARWTSCDPAGLVDGPNLYRYARDNPVRLTDAAGTEPDDPTAPPTLNGVGLTIGGGKVRLGPLTAPASGPCDELYAACGSWTLSPGTPPDSAGSGSGQAGGTDDDDIPGDPFGILHALKTYSPAPASDLAWRKSNPSVDPDPFGEGFLPKDPAGQYSIADHALAHHKLKGEGTPYISASRKPGGADTMNGEPFAIDVQAVKDAGTKVHETSDIAHALDQAAKDHPLIKPVHVEWWKKAQQTTEGVPVKPGDPLRGEILFEGPVPPGAIVTTGRQAVKYLGRGLMVAAVAMTVWDLGKSVVDSFKQGSPLPLAREAIRQGATWGTMAVGAEVGAEIGSLIAPPIGTIVGGIVGGIAGGLAGYIEGSWLADLF